MPVATMTGSPASIARHGLQSKSTSNCHRARYIANGMSIPEANEQSMRESAELIRKYGEEAAKALIK